MIGRSVSFAAALLAAFAATEPLLSVIGGEEYPELPRRITGETDEARAERMAWWRHDRFGMFIHFGLYSVAARHEWVKSNEYIPDDEYDAKYFSRFDPDLLDAKAWVAAPNRIGDYRQMTT